MNYKEEITGYCICSCGAVTLFHRNGSNYCCDLKNRDRFLPGLDLRKLRKLTDCFCCDHCVNHYGLDICACGSGEPFWECDNGFEECGSPMQALGGYDKVMARDAWLAG